MKKLVTNLQVTSSCQHRLDSSHAIVIVMLGGQLLRAQTVHSYYLYRQGASLYEATGVEGDLSNQGIVWHHHGHCTEQGLCTK